MIEALAGLGAVGLGVAGWKVSNAIRARGLDRWIPSTLAHPPRLPEIDDPAQPLDVFLAVCDHYEPEWGQPNIETARQRVLDWRRSYPRLFDEFRDVNGRPPQHTFFFPQDQYRPEYLDPLSELVERGYGDVDVHLHHDGDTAASLTDKLAGFRDTLHQRHGLLRRDPITGEIVYGFIHGNWALCNSRRDGRWCGVDHELPVLIETGCYADFTFPSAPSDTQPSAINGIYYARDTAAGRRAHESGEPAQVGKAPPTDSLLMIQGPLLLDFSRRKWGLLPKVENGDLLASHPPSVRRLPAWLSAGVTIQGKPRWRFVKLHTHGCKPVNQQMWLGETVRQFHADLARYQAAHPGVRLHYVTAWEMAQLVRQAVATEQSAGNESGRRQVSILA